MRRIAYLFFLLFVYTHSASADSSIKRLILEDCPQAIVAWAKLSTAEKKSFVPYLERILELTSKPVDNSAQFFPQKLTPLDEPQGLDLWRTLEPGREIEAKRCAIDFLAGMHAEALDAVPMLLAAAIDTSLPDDLQDHIDLTIFQIIKESAATPETQFQTAWFEKIIQALGGDVSILARNVLIESYTKSIPFLIHRLIKANTQERTWILDVLKEADSSGQAIGPGLIDLLSSTDDNLVMMLIPKIADLPAARDEAVPVFVKLLKDRSSEVQLAACAGLGQMKRRVEDQTAWPPEQVLKTVVYSLLIPNEALTNCASKNIVAWGSSDLIRLLLPLTNHSDEHVRAQIATIFGSLLSTKSIALPEEIYSTLTRLLYDPSPVVVSQTIQALGHARNQITEVVNAFSKLLKSNSSEKDPTKKAKILFEIASALQTLQASQAGVRLSPYMVEALALPKILEKEPALTPAEHPAVQTLLNFGSGAVGTIINARKIEDSVVRARIAYLLGRILPAQASQVSALVELLQDQNLEVSTEAKRSLVLLGEASVPELRKALSRKKSPLQEEAAKLLLALKQKDESALKIVEKEALQGECLARITSYKLLLEFSQARAQAISEKMLDCLNSEAPVALRVSGALLQTQPLPGTIRAKLLELLSNQATPLPVRLNIIQNAASAKIPFQDISGSLLSLLKSSETSAITVALDALNEYGVEAKPILKDLKDSLSDLREQVDLKFKLVRILVKIDLESIDLSGILKQELDHRLGCEAMLRTQNLIADLGPEISIPLLRGFLGNAPLQVRVAAIQTLGNFGVHAISAREDLKNFLGDKDPEERYRALVALIQIDSSIPELSALLRQMLVTRYWLELKPQLFTGDAASLLNNLISNSLSHLELQRARALQAPVPGN